MESNALRRNGPDIIGYEEIFGKPLWRNKANQRVHSFVTCSIGMEDKVELQVELVSDDSIMRALDEPRCGSTTPVRGS